MIGVGSLAMAELPALFLLVWEVVSEKKELIAKNLYI